VAEPTFISSITYQEPKKMYRWLEDAFGFEPAMVICDADGDIAHAEMSFGDGRIMVGYPWDVTVSPLAVNGANTQRVHVYMDGDIDAHCERARAAGAAIVAEPADQFYGARTYRAKDLEGHLWTFAQEVKVVTPQEWDAQMGLTSTTRLPE